MCSVVGKVWETALKCEWYQKVGNCSKGYQKVQNTSLKRNLSNKKIIFHVYLI